MKHPPPRPFVVSRETEDRLRAYADLLTRWNRTINLVSRNDIADVWNRHIEDVLQLVPLLPPNLTDAIDLGSGAGLPGLVLAIATNCHFHLIESDQRKAAFLGEATRITGAQTTVHACRIETATIPRVRLVTARALAPLSTLIELALPFLDQDGSLLAPKGQTAEAELTAAQTRWHMRVERIASVTSPAATILKITEVSRVGRQN